jgi:hypothetical protein
VQNYNFRFAPSAGTTTTIQPGETIRLESTMERDRKDTRILIYSHDTFGLGHLRRCRTIAHALVDRFKHLSVLILSGSPIIGSFDFRSRVDFVRVPGVVKLRNGEYTSLNLHIDVEETLAHARLDHQAHGRDVRSRHLHRRQGAAGPARRGDSRRWRCSSSAAPGWCWACAM